MKYKQLKNRCCRNCIHREDTSDNEIFKCNFSNIFYFRSLGEFTRWRKKDACSFKNKYKLI